MKRFSETTLAAPYNGRDSSPFPALVQVNTNLWQVCMEFSYTADDGVRYTAPAGMLTDMASIPRPLWNILPPAGGPYSGAAVIHDYLYQTQITSKGRADDLFGEMMDMADVPHLTKQIIVEGVRVGGWDAWNKHTAELRAK